MTVVFEIEESQEGYHNLITQETKAYEVQLSEMPIGAQWRRNHKALVICRSAAEAIRLAETHWPNDPMIHSVQLRNNGMVTIVSGVTTKLD